VYISLFEVRPFLNLKKINKTNLFQLIILFNFAILLTKNIFNNNENHYIILLLRFKDYISKEFYSQQEFYLMNDLRLLRYSICYMDLKLHFGEINYLKNSIFSKFIVHVYETCGYKIVDLLSIIIELFH
jgi:hypothetical protein